VKTLAPFLIRTALAGLVLIIPIAVIFLAVMEIWDLLEEMTALGGMHLPFPPVINGLIYAAIILLSVFAICLLVGLSLRTRLGARTAEYVQKALVDRIPMLGLIKNLTMSLTGMQSELRPVEVDIQGCGTSVWGFLMETLDDGRQVVFVPSSPAMTIGQTYLVPPERVTLLERPRDVVNALGQWGLGAGAVYRHDSQPGN